MSEVYVSRYSTFFGLLNTYAAKIIQSAGTMKLKAGLKYKSLLYSKRVFSRWRVAQQLTSSRLKRSRPKNESEIQWPAYLSEAPLTGFSAHLLQQKWKRLSTKYIKKHGEPTKFKKLLKGMLVEAKNMPDKPARAAKKAASDASGAFKSAEFVESEDEDEEELPEA
jgi:hypothetical protein